MDDGIPSTSPPVCKEKTVGQHNPSTAKATLTLEWEEFSPGFETIENGFSEDLASDTEEGKATIVIIDVRLSFL